KASSSASQSTGTSRGSLEPPYELLGSASGMDVLTVSDRSKSAYSEDGLGEPYSPPRAPPTAVRSRDAGRPNLRRTCHSFMIVGGPTDGCVRCWPDRDPGHRAPPRIFSRCPSRIIELGSESALDREHGPGLLRPLVQPHADGRQHRGASGRGLELCGTLDAHTRKV